MDLLEEFFFSAGAGFVSPVRRCWALLEVSPGLAW